MKLISVWHKIPNWLRLFLPGVAASLIAALIFPPINLFLGTIWIFTKKLINTNIPDIVLLGLSITAIIVSLTNRKSNSAGSTRIKLKYPGASISVLERLAGSEDHILEKKDILVTLSKSGSRMKTADFHILLDDLTSNQLIKPIVSPDSYDDSDNYSITTEGFQYLYDQTRKEDSDKKV